jgi:CDP-diglyceride synthetase
MKKDVPLNELTLNELKAKKKTVQGAVTGLGCVLLIAYIACLYLAITAKKISLVPVVIGCTLMFLPGLTNLRQINSEISQRSSK